MSSLTETRFPYTTLFRSGGGEGCAGVAGAAGCMARREEGGAQRCAGVGRARGAGDGADGGGGQGWGVCHGAGVGCMNELLSIPHRSEEHTSELQSLMRISYAVFCLKKNKKK